MTDLQVKYQTLQHEKDKLAEERRLHDAQIKQYSASAQKSLAELPLIHAQTSKYEAELPLLDAQTQKYLQDASLTEKDVAWYTVNSVSDIFHDVATGIGSLMQGKASMLTSVGKLIPVIGGLFK